MGKAKDLPVEKISEITALIKHSDHSLRQIAVLTNVSAMTVSRIKAKIDKNIVTNNQRRGKCGRQRITTPRDERKIRDICLQNRRKSSKSLTQVINEAGITISPRTTRRRLKEMGFKCCRPAKKPKLTPAMRAKRLAWAKQHRHMTAEDWENVSTYYISLLCIHKNVFFQVIFSDESHLEIMMDKSSFVRRREDEKYHPDCVAETVKHPQKIMVWSAISGKGTGRLYVVNGMMNQVQYRKVLEEKLMPQLKEWYLDTSKCIFMHDSAPCHKAKTITAYLAQEKVNVLPWPGNSPDLNPIENAWELLKRKVAKETTTNKRLLTEALIKIWHHDEELKENIKKCIQSMPKRVQAVIEAKGGSTKY